MKIEQIAVENLIPYARNARTHSSAQVSKIAGSIREFGFCNPVLIDANDGIIAGHGRVMAAQKLDLKEVPCIRLGHLNDTQRRAYILADNRIALDGEWDIELLNLEIQDLKELDFDLDLTGFDADELAGIELEGESETEGDTEPQADRADELRKKWDVKPGDLWALGEHRLLCGDSTKAEDVARVMGGGKADLCLTDPPYGIADTNSNKNNCDEYDDSIENLIKLIAGFLPLAKNTAPVVVLTPGNGNQLKYPESTWRMAWFTPAGIGCGPWGFCCWQPILCYGKDPKLTKGLGSHPDAIVHTESADKLGHPCSKPIGFWEWLMNRTSEEGETIYEPFLGSGTTLIACDNLKRKCRAIEISPAYVAVALERWATHTGKTPTRIHA